MADTPATLRGIAPNPLPLLRLPRPWQAGSPSAGTAAEAIRLWPLLTARGYYETDFPMSPTNVAQVSRMRDGLRLAGIRDHADGDADHGLDSDVLLHTDYEALTPSTAPGAKTIHTSGLAALLEQEKPLVLDTVPWGKSIPGAIGLRGAGIGGGTSDEYQERLRTRSGS